MTLRFKVTEILSLVRNDDFLSSEFLMIQERGFGQTTKLTGISDDEPIVNDGYRMEHRSADICTAYSQRMKSRNCRVPRIASGRGAERQAAHIRK